MFSMHGICKSFGGIEVLSDISLTLQPGERIGITGANGVGKSTLINIATGFLTPDHGWIQLNDLMLTNCPAWEFAREGIRRTFQSSRFLQTATLEEQLFQAGHTPEYRNRLADLLHDSSLQSSLHLFPDEISLPVLRKAEVVRGLAAQPEILFLDEPSAGLTADELHQFGTFLNQKLGRQTALVVVEHRLDFMVMITDTVMEMKLNQELQVRVD